MTDEYVEGNGVCDRCGMELDYSPYTSLDGMEWLCEDCYGDEFKNVDDEYTIIGEDDEQV